jgi:hypothetical protein
MAGFQLDYKSLLVNSDHEARGDYDFDPRVAFQATATPTQVIEPINYVAPPPLTSTQPTIEELTDSPDMLETLTLPVQQPPTMIPFKRMVVIDTAQRDWTVQPDAYSNVFSFGTQLPLSNDGPQVAYYFNNPTIPLAAYETPSNALRVPVGQIKQTIPNNNPLSFPPDATIPSYFSTINQGLVHPTYGWSIVLAKGIPIHSPQTFSFSDPTIQVLFYPVYDSAQTAGAQIGIDIQPSRYGINNYIFSTQLALSNVAEIKFLRAVLPVRGTQPYKPTAFAENISYPDAFHMQSYVLMTIQNLKGNYYGGSQIVQNAFSILTQNTRNIYDGAASLPAQFSDYYPLGEESYLFDPPLSRMSNANIQLYNNAGIPFSQVDGLSIVAMNFDTVNIGSIQFVVAQPNASVSGDLTDSNAFLKTDIRVGDEIKLYSPTLTQIGFDASCSPALSALSYLMSNNFLITGINSNDFTPSFVFPSSDIGTSFTAVPKLTSGYTGLSNAVSTIRKVIQTTSQVSLVQYSRVTSPSLTFMNTRTFSQDYPIALLNINTQATFVMEVTTLEPDPTNIKKIIPN